MLLLSCFIALSLGYSLEIAQGPSHSYSGDNGTWTNLVLSTALKGLMTGATLSHDNIYFLPGLSAQPVPKPVPSGLACDVAYLTDSKLYFLPASTPDKLKIVDCQPTVQTCSFQVSQTISVPVPVTTQWKYTLSLPYGVSKFMLYFVSNEKILRVTCGRSSHACNASSVHVVDVSSVAEHSAYYNEVVNVVTTSLGYSDGSIYLALGGIKGPAGPGQIVQMSTGTDLAMAASYTTSPPSMFDIYSDSGYVMAWAVNTAPKNGSIQTWNVDSSTYRSISIPFSSQQVFTAGALLQQQSGGFYVSAAAPGAAGYTVHYVLLNQQEAAAPLPIAHDAAPTVSFVDGDNPQHYWIGTRESGNAKLSAYYLRPLYGHFNTPLEPVVERALVPRRNLTADCVDSSMSPTCWLACPASPAICGPNKHCGKPGTSCYVLASQPDCCNYCPPEWSMNC